MNKHSTQTHHQTCQLKYNEEEKEKEKEKERRQTGRGRKRVRGHLGGGRQPASKTLV